MTKVLGAALIGAGMVSEVYLAALAGLTDRIALRAVTARSRASAERLAAAAADRLGSRPEVLDHVDAVAAHPDVDVAILITPPDARLAPVAALAGAGKAILTEKPLARSLDEAAQVVSLCEAAGVPLGVTLQHRARPLAADLLARAGQGAFGRLFAAEVDFGWWRGQDYYDAPGRGSFARDGGGVLLTQAIHTLDLMLRFTGPATDVTAFSATTAAHRMETEDFVSAGLRFANGAVGQVFASTAAFPGRAELLRLHYDRASATLGPSDLTIAWRDGRVETTGQSAGSGAGGADPMAFTSDWHQTLIADFAAAVAGGRAPMVTGRSALEVHGLIDAMERSARAGQRVEIGTGLAG